MPVRKVIITFWEGALNKIGLEKIVLSSASAALNPIHNSLL